MAKLKRNNVSAMFVRIKKTDKYEYIQIVENKREGKHTIQRVLVSLGRADKPRTKDKMQQLLVSLNGRIKKLNFPHI